MQFDAGLIRFGRGVVTISDRRTARGIACEDYRLTRDIYHDMYRPSCARVVKVATGWVTQIVSRIHGLPTTDPPLGVVVVVVTARSLGKGAWPIGGPQRAR